MQSLKVVALSTSCGSWVSIRTCAALAQHLTVEDIRLPAVLQKNVQALENMPDKLFPRVNRLSLYCKELEFPALRPFAAYITDFNLEPEGMPATTVPLMDDFSRLRMLFIEFPQHVPGNPLNASNLLRLARECPGLDFFFLRALKVNAVQGSEISDETIDQVATALPKLENFQLFAENTRLTELSLISLGQHCRSLRSCYLSANISYWEVAHNSGSQYFPNLIRLTVLLTTGQVGYERQRWDNVEDIAKRLLSIMPKLQQLLMTGDGLSAEGELESAHRQALKKAMAPVLNQRM